MKLLEADENGDRTPRQEIRHRLEPVQRRGSELDSNQPSQKSMLLQDKLNQEKQLREEEMRKSEREKDTEERRKRKEPDSRERGDDATKRRKSNNGRGSDSPNVRIKQEPVDPSDNIRIKQEPVDDDKEDGGSRGSKRRSSRLSKS